MMNDEKTAVIEDMQKQISGLLEQVKFLTEQNQMLRSRLFGRKSEQKISLIPDGQLSLLDSGLFDGAGIFNEAESFGDSPQSDVQLEEITYKRKKRKGKRELDFGGLPTQQIVHELPEAERVCPDCRGPPSCLRT